MSDSLGVFLIVYGIQMLILILALLNNDVKSKIRFLVHCIPFAWIPILCYVIIVETIKAWNKLPTE